MTGGLELTTLRDFAIALLIGALVGIDREKRKPEAGASSAPGVRTFMLLALLGAVGAWLSREFATPWILVGVSLGVAGVVIASYVVHAQANPEALGVTTELAGLAVCLVGAITMLGQAPLAAALGIAISALLTFKQPIHGLVRKLGTEDLHAGLKLLIATFIVLPVLPNRAVDPWEAINPYKLWWLVVLISGLSLVGYVATRWLGPERGLAITGVTGGLVSSTAVTLTFAKRSREGGVEADQGRTLAIGILLAWVVMFGRMMVEVAVVNRAMLGVVIIPVGTMGGVAVVLAAWYYFRAKRTAGATNPTTAHVPLKNPFSLTSAMKFALFFTLVLLVVKGAQRLAPDTGFYFVAVLAGSTDVDAITLSMAGYAKQSGDAVVATRAITLAALSNTAVKTGLVVFLGSAGLRKHLLPAAIIILISGLAAMWAL